MNSWVLVHNRAADENLYTWKPLAFDVPTTDVRRLVKEFDDDLEVGDLVGVIEAEYVSDIVPHFQHLMMVGEHGMIDMPTTRASFRGANYLHTFLLPDLDMLDLWDDYAHFSVRECIGLCVLCLPLLDHSLTRPMLREAISQFNQWLEEDRFELSVTGRPPPGYDYGVLSIAAFEIQDFGFQAIGIMLHMIRETKATHQGMREFFVKIAMSISTKAILKKAKPPTDAERYARISEIIRPYFSFQKAVLSRAE